MPEAPDTYFPAFLEDYYAECDEHFTLIQQHLLKLEAYIDQPQVDSTLLDGLFRSFHTLKGLSGMVALQPAEQLAHQMESYLRTLRDGKIYLSGDGLEVLIAGTRRLEQVVTAHRNQLPLPEVESVAVQLEAVLADTTQLQPQPATAAPPVNSQMPSQPTATEAAIVTQHWRFQFIPVAAWVEQGFNVNWVREHLQAIGTILHAEPLITPDGGVQFEFLVETDADAATFAAWCQDKVTYQREAIAPLTLAAPAPHAVTSLEPAAIAPKPVPTAGSLRVDLSKLDDLMRMVSELVIARSRLEYQLTQIAPALTSPQRRALQDVSTHLEQQIRNLRDGITRVRLVPIGEIFVRMQFVLRDLLRETGKEAALQFSGQETEIDKFIVERMLDPLMHLVRNAISHGLEPVSDRLSQGKPAAGCICLRAFTSGEQVVIQVEDDGCGIEVKQVAARARDLGILNPEQTLDQSQLLDILCLSGFSTRDQANLASGRGVGMAVVQDTVHHLGGSLSLKTQPGVGSCFTIQLPLTLAIADALIVKVSQQTYAIPMASVWEVMAIAPDAVMQTKAGALLPHRGRVLPLFHLAPLMGLPQSAAPELKGLIIQSGTSQVGLAVDRIAGQQEIVVRVLTDPLIQTPGIMGATDLGDGQAVLIVDVAQLLKTLRRRNHPLLVPGAEETLPEVGRSPDSHPQSR